MIVDLPLARALDRAYALQLEGTPLARIAATLTTEGHAAPDAGGWDAKAVAKALAQRATLRACGPANLDRLRRAGGRRG